MLLVTDQSHHGKGHAKGLDEGYTVYPGGQKSPDQMESKESEEDEIEDNSFMGKLKKLFGRGKKKDDDSDRIVGLGMPFNFVTTGAD